MPEDEAGTLPIVNIVGELMALGPPRRALIPRYQRWVNDFATTRNLGFATPQTLERETAWYDRATGTDRLVRFTIYERATWRPIGSIELLDLDYRHGTATLGLLIGEIDARGKGFGTEATRLMLDYAFTALGLHNVMLRVFAFNHAGLRAYAKAGFREFGRRHRCHALAGRRWDEVYMECLAEDFRSPVLAAVLTPELARDGAPPAAES